MELTPQQERKLKKLAQFADSNEIATVDSFIELEDKVDLINENINDKLDLLSEELKKNQKKN